MEISAATAVRVVSIVVEDPSRRSIVWGLPLVVVSEQKEYYFGIGQIAGGCVATNPPKLEQGGTEEVI